MLLPPPCTMPQVHATGAAAQLRQHVCFRYTYNTSAGPRVHASEAKQVEQPKNPGSHLCVDVAMCQWDAFCARQHLCAGAWRGIWADQPPEVSIPLMHYACVRRSVVRQLGRPALLAATYNVDMVGIATAAVAELESALVTALDELARVNLVPAGKLVSTILLFSKAWYLAGAACLLGFTCGPSRSSQGVGALLSFAAAGMPAGCLARADACWCHAGPPKPMGNSALH